MRSKAIRLQDFFNTGPPWLHTGNYVPVHPRKLHFVLVLVWGFSNFLECHLTQWCHNSSFQYLMNKILWHVAVYFDDILIHSSDESSPCTAFTRSFWQIMLCRVDCAYMWEEVPPRYVQNYVTSQQMRCRQVNKRFNLANTNQHHSSLGIASYYQHYIQHFADIASPLTALTQKNIFGGNQIVLKILKCWRSVSQRHQYWRHIHNLAPVCQNFQFGLGAVLEQSNQTMQVELFPLLRNTIDNVSALQFCMYLNNSVNIC